VTPRDPSRKRTACIECWLPCEVRSSPPRALLEAGARKDMKTDAGSTALSLARKNGHASICKQPRLVGACKRKDERAEAGETVLDMSSP